MSLKVDSILQWDAAGCKVEASNQKPHDSRMTGGARSDALWAAHCMIASALLAPSLGHGDAGQCRRHVAQEFIGRMP